MGSTVYLTKHGIVSIDNSFDVGTDFEHPLELCYLRFLDLNRLSSQKEYYDIIHSKEYVYIGVSSDMKNQFYISKRTEANAYVFFERIKVGENRFSLLKKLKRQVKEVIKDLNFYYKGEVYNYSLYDFEGNIIDGYYGIFGDETYNSMRFLLGPKLKDTKVYKLRTCFDYISSEIQINNLSTIKYLSTKFKTTDLGDFIEVEFNNCLDNSFDVKEISSDIFMKDEVLCEFQDTCNKYLELQKIWNKMFLFIIDDKLKEYC
jgi:hypothetical protein